MSGSLGLLLSILLKHANYVAKISVCTSLPNCDVVLRPCLTETLMLLIKIHLNALNFQPNNRLALELFNQIAIF